MAKVCSGRKHEIRWEDDICAIVEDAWFEVLDVLNSKYRVDGHDTYDQWLMKVEFRLKDLIDTLNEDPTEIQDTLEYKQIL